MGLCLLIYFPVQNSPDNLSIRYLQADLENEKHQHAVLDMVDAYSRDPMGDGAPLPAEIRERLIPGLRSHPTTLIFLAFDGDTPVGVAVCFLHFRRQTADQSPRRFHRADASRTRGRSRSARGGRSEGARTRLLQTHLGSLGP